MNLSLKSIPERGQSSQQDPNCCCVGVSVKGTGPSFPSGRSPCTAQCPDWAHQPGGNKCSKEIRSESGVLKDEVETPEVEIRGRWGNASGSLYLLLREERQDPQPILNIPGSSLSPATYLSRAKGSCRHHKLSGFIIFNKKIEIKRFMICPKSHGQNSFFNNKRKKEEKKLVIQSNAPY